MKEISVDLTADIKKLISEKLLALKKKLDPAVGNFIVNLWLPGENREGEVLVIFENPGALTEKELKLIRKTIEQLVQDKLSVKVQAKIFGKSDAAKHRVELVSETDRVVIPTRFTKRHVEELLEVICSEHPAELQAKQKISIAKFLADDFKAGETIQKRKLTTIFLQLLWPDLSRAQQRYPAIVDIHIQSITSALDYAEAVALELARIHQDNLALFDRIHKEHPMVAEFLLQNRGLIERKPTRIPPYAAEFLASGQGELFLDELRQKKEDLMSLKRDLSERAIIGNDVYIDSLIAARIMASFLKYHRYIRAHALVHEFITLFGQTWYTKQGDPQQAGRDNIFAITGLLVEESSGNFNGLRKRFPYFISCIDLLVDEITAKIAEVALTVEEDKIQRLLKDKLRLEQAQLAKLPVKELVTHDTLTKPELSLNVTFNRESDVTAEVRANALKTIQREQEKKALRSHRIFERQAKGPIWLQSNADARDAPSQEGFTLRVSFLKKEGELELDVYQGAARNLESSCFHLTADQYVIVVDSIVELNRDQRRLLLNSEGRGFIGAVSPGMTGVKYFREGFAVLKADDEARVLCAKKELIVDASMHKVDVFVPVMIIANHEEYEAMLTTPKLADKLRGLIDSACLLEVCELPAYTPTI